MASALLFAVCALCLLQCILFKRDFFGPISVYLFSQCLSLGISWFCLMPLMTPWHANTWAVFIESAITFTLGCICARLAWAARHPAEKITSNSPTRELLERANRGYNWSLHMALTVLAFLYFCTGVVAEFRDIGTLILFSKNIAYHMTIEGCPNVGIFAYPLNSAPLVCVLCAIGCFSRLDPHRKLRIAFRILFVLAICLGFIVMPNRISIFSISLIVAYLFNLVCKRIKPLAIILGIVLAVAAFMGVAQVKGQSGNVLDALAEKGTWTLPYSYIANNWWNLDYALNRPVDQNEHPQIYGLEFIHGLLMPTPVIGKIFNAYGFDGIFNNSSAKTPSLNTIPYQWSLYKDFGYPGAVAIPFLFGLFIGTLYALARSRGRIAHIALYSVILFFVTLWFFEEFWANFLYVSWAAAILFVTSLCGRGTKSGKEPPERILQQ